MKSFYLTSGIFIIIAVILLSGCVEKETEKEISMKISDIIATVDTDVILFYVEFNDSVEGEVKFYILDKNDTYIGSARIENKTALLLFNNSDRKLKAGNYKLKVECKSINKEKIFNLQILKYPAYIQMELNFERIYFKDPLEISVNLNSQNNSNKEIYIFANEKLIGKDLTDDEGNAKFSLNLMNFSNALENKVKIIALYKGDDFFENSTAEQEIVITRRIPTKIIAENIIEESDVTSIVISPSVRTYKDEIINASLKFYYGNEKINIINITEKNYTKDYTLNISKFKKGNYKIDITFDGNEIYENSSKSIILSLAKVYENSGVKIKSFTDEKISGLRNKKFSIYTDNTSWTKSCAYEFADIADQKNGMPLYIFAAKENEIIIDKNFVQIFTKKDNKNLPCHVFLCEYKNINCSLSKIFDTLGNYENFTVVIDTKIIEKNALKEYLEMLKAFGFIREYLKEKKNKEVSINQYVMENNKCASSKNLKNFTDCNFEGIFIIYSNKSEIYTKNGKIFLNGNEDTLYYEEMILKTIILPEWKELLK